MATTQTIRRTALKTPPATVPPVAKQDPQAAQARKATNPLLPPGTSNQAVHRTLSPDPQVVPQPGMQASRSLRARIVFAISQGPKGFAIHRWYVIAMEAPGGFSRDEQAALDTVIGNAVIEREMKDEDDFRGTIEAREVQFDLAFQLWQLEREQSRGLLASQIGNYLQAAIRTARGVEELHRQQQRDRLRFAPRPGLTAQQELVRETANLREEIARMRAEIRVGLAEQQAAQGRLGQFAAFLATSPEPDPGGWASAEWGLKQAEASLALDDPRSANLFMSDARGVLKSQQDWWARYKHSYDFGNEVIAPVFWQAFSLLSLGFVDEQLFDVSAEAAKKGFGNQLLTVAGVLYERLRNLLTFGGYDAWEASVKKQIEKAPDEPIWKAMLAAGPDAVQGVIDTMLPIAEVKTMAGVATKDEKTGKTTTPDVWARVGAFFSALMKVAMLAEMAKGKGKGGAREGLKVEPGDVEKTPANTSREGEPVTGEKPARAPGKGDPPALKRPAGTILTPDGFPHVLLVDVTEPQFHALLAELENSTPKGAEVAKRIRSGELHITLDSEGLTPTMAGAAMPNEVHVQWGASVHDTAGIAIHEAVHNADPILKSGARTEIEANARVHEYEYRALRNLEPYDEAEAIYRAILERGKHEGVEPAAALAEARKAVIDMMQTDPERYGVEKPAAPTSASNAPAKAPLKGKTAATPITDPVAQQKAIAAQEKARALAELAKIRQERAANPPKPNKPPTGSAVSAKEAFESLSDELRKDKRDFDVKADLADPLVAVLVGGGESSKKGQYTIPGAKELADLQKDKKKHYVILPKSQAEAQGFRQLGTARDFTIEPRREGETQLESSGAGRRGEHDITGRTRSKTTEQKNAASFKRTVGADLAQAFGYNELLSGVTLPDGTKLPQERGLLRPGNISTGGVDAITTDVSGPKAKIYLNDFTDVDTSKPGKSTHADWRQELLDAVKGNRLDLGDKAAEAKIRKAIDDGDVYVRTVRVDFEPDSGKPRTVTPGTPVRVK